MKSKSIFFIYIYMLCLIFCFTISPTYLYAENQMQIVVVSDTAKVYDISSKEGEVLGTASFGDVFTVQDTENDFYKIEFNQTTGFIQKAYCQNYALKPLEYTLDTNATLKKDCNVYFKISNEFEKQEIVLEAGTRVKLLSGSQSSKEFAEITVEYENQNLTCFVEFNNVNADGIPIKTVMVILLITTCVALFLILFGIYTKVKKNKK